MRWSILGARSAKIVRFIRQSFSIRDSEVKRKKALVGADVETITIRERGKVNWGHETRGMSGKVLARRALGRRE